MEHRWFLLAWLVALPAAYVRWCVQQLRKEDEAFERLTDEERATRIGDEFP